VNCINLNENTNRIITNKDHANTNLKTNGL
jgi:hypothetical protein